jgi:hypothetical protein
MSSVCLSTLLLRALFIVHSSMICCAWSCDKPKIGSGLLMHYIPNIYLTWQKIPPF